MSYLDKKQFLRLIIAITSVCLAIAGILFAVLVERIPSGFRWVSFIIGVAFCILSIYEFTKFVLVHIYKNRKIIDLSIAKARIAHERQIEKNSKRFTEELKQDKSEICMSTSDSISVNVFGKMKSLKLFIKRSENEIYEPSIYDYDKLKKDVPYKVSVVFLNNSELNALKWIVKTLPHNSDKIKADLLEYVNLCNERHDDWEKAQSFEVLPYEIDIKTVCLDFSQESEVIALCGDCNCDMEHGIAIAFRNRKFAGVFIETDNFDDNGQLKAKYKEFCGK